MHVSPFRRHRGLLAGLVMLSVGAMASAQSFLNVSATVGFQPAFLANIPAGGLAVDDLDRNGYPDIFVTADGAVQMRELRAGEARGSSHEKALHFGLGTYTSAAVRVPWPDGTEEDLGSMPADQYHAHQHPLATMMFRNGFE